MTLWAEAKRLSFVVDEISFREVLSRFNLEVSDDLTPEEFRDVYRERFYNDGWPRDFSIVDAETVREGILVRSLSGKILGRTTGNRRKCASELCPGWFVEVMWETGQKFWPCSEGWHYFRDAEQGAGRIDIIGGGEISARFISPKPLGTHPRDRREWPSKKALSTMRGWRVVVAPPDGR